MGRKRRKVIYRTVGANALKEPASLQAATPANPANQSSATADFDPQSEYLAGYGRAWGGAEQSLPSQRTEANAPEVTFDTYRQMLNDPEISSDVRTLRDMVLGDGIQLSPGVEGKPVDEDSAEFAKAQEIAEFVDRNLKGLRKPFKNTLEGLVESAITYGHKTAEITWKLGAGADKNRLVLDKVALKDYRTLDFVVDAYWNHLGFSPRVPTAFGRSVIPREKFLHLALHEEDEDPRGRSSIRCVYTAWTFKQLTWPEYKRWLDNCALPTTVGKLAPKQAGDVQRNADGTKLDGGRLLSPAEAFGSALAGLKNAGYVVIPNGAEVDQLAVVGEGAGFERAINVADSQISKGILYQTLATSEAQFGTRAQSETHMGVLDLLVWWLKGKVSDAITNDLVKSIIRYNFGDEALKFAPIVSLGDTERRDWSVDATAAAQIEPAITDSQWGAVTTQLGLPAPLPGEKPRRDARAEAGAGPVQTPAPNNQKAGMKFRPRGALGFVGIRIRRGT